MVRDQTSDIAKLLDVMRALRDPETGCDWDRVQTFDSIMPYTIEEAYEVGDAVARGDLLDLRDELGDLLLQVVYHARMAEELGAFTFDDVVSSITDKMIRRHPHVFGDVEVRDEIVLDGLWERVKKEERAEKAREREVKMAEQPDLFTPRVVEETGYLGSVPTALAPLREAVKLQKRAARVGFDWSSLAPVMDKLAEETAELREAVAKADDGAASAAAVQDELGDVLFVLANIARHLSVDPEVALKGTNSKFRRRFSVIEQAVDGDEERLASLSLEEMEALWQAAKGSEVR